MLIRPIVLSLAACGQVNRLLDHERAVHQEQRLLRRSRLRPLRRVRVRVREVERAEERRQILPLDETVHGSPRGERRVGERHGRARPSFHRAGRPRRASRRAAIPDRAGGDWPATAGDSPASTATQSARWSLACRYVLDSTIWRMSRFVDQPSSINSQASQSSSSGCVGGVPRTPKSLGVATKRRAEQVSPHAIDPHARRERIVAAGDRLGHFAPAAAVLKRLRLCVRRQAREKPPLDLRAPAARIAAQKNAPARPASPHRRARRRIVARLFLASWRTRRTARSSRPR